MPLPDPPPDLDPEHTTIWTDTLTALREAGRTDRVDINSMRAYVNAVHTYQRAQRLIAASDVLVEAGGHLTPNPALAVAHQATAQMRSFSRAFGLTRVRPMQDPEPLRDDGHPGKWCEEHGRHECTGQRSRGRGPCHGSAQANGKCRMHSGNELGLAAAQLVRTPTYLGVRRDITAGQALLEEVQRTAGIVGYLDTVIAALERDNLVWGIEREALVGSGEFPGVDVIRSAKPSVWVQLHQRERSHLVAVCEAALRANIDERLVRLAEGQGLQFAQCLNLIFKDLDLSVEQWAMVPDVVPRRMREMIAA
jgi:P27 family predicted phage terminase small subunit